MSGIWYLAIIWWPESGLDVKTQQVRRPVSGKNFVSGRWGIVAIYSDSGAVCWLKAPYAGLQCLTWACCAFHGLPMHYGDCSALRRLLLACGALHMFAPPFRFLWQFIVLCAPYAGLWLLTLAWGALHRLVAPYMGLRCLMRATEA